MVTMINDGNLATVITVLTTMMVLMLDRSMLRRQLGVADHYCRSDSANSP
jgi:hypothetical protein